MEIIFSIFVLFAVFLVIMAVRNMWVFNRRIELINKNIYPLDDYYLNYDKMMLRFWVWDVEKLKKPSTGKIKAQ